MYDAVLLVSFGGPENREDVIPFLENVLRGRDVPHERLLEVAEHYYHFGGVSPINRQCRELIAALAPGLDVPLYWGNRNWAPYLADTLLEMRDAGVKRVLAIATSAFGSYSGCRQYLEDIVAARAAVPDAPEIDKLPPFWSDEGFIEAMAARVAEAVAQLPGAEVVYTAHSIPAAMARSSPYEQQLRDACARVHARAGLNGTPVLAWQSRSGPPSQPWLEPDISDHIRATHPRRLIVVPIGFLSDHMEVVYDLDTEVAALTQELNIEFLRAGTVGTHPLFVEALVGMVRDAMRLGVTNCASDCCPAMTRPAVRRA